MTKVLALILTAGALAACATSPLTPDPIVHKQSVSLVLTGFTVERCVEALCAFSLTVTNPSAGCVSTITGHTLAGDAVQHATLLWTVNGVLAPGAQIAAHGINYPADVKLTISYADGVPVPC